MKFVRLMDGNISNESGLETKIDEVIIARDWNPTATERDEITGINFSTDESILRWIRSGDTLYYVILPDDAEVKKVPGTFTPDGLFRANKLILTNPVKLTQDVILDLYNKSKLPERINIDNIDNIDKYIEDYIEFDNDIKDGNYGLYYEYKEKLLD